MATSYFSVLRLGVVIAIVLSRSLFGQTLHDLGTLGGTYSFGFSVNDSGQVAGIANTPNGDNHAFLYTGGSIQDLPALGGYNTGNGINSSGQVVGYGYLPSPTTAFLYSNGVMTTLPILGGIYGSSATGINDLGQIVGTSSVTVPVNSNHAFIYSNGVMTDLGTLGGKDSSAAAINNNGEVTGSSYLADNVHQHAMVYSAGTMVDIGSLGGTQGAAGLSINDSGQVAGESYTTDGAIHAFEYSGGVMTDLGTLGGAESVAQGINDSGSIVGYSSTLANASTHAFEFSNGVMTDLDLLYSNLLSDGTSAGFINITAAYAISNNGLITGEGQYYDGNGNYTTNRAFLLDTRTSVPASDIESTLGLLAFCIAGLLGVRRRFGIRKRLH